MALTKQTVRPPLFEIERTQISDEKIHISISSILQQCQANLRQIFVPRPSPNSIAYFAELFLTLISNEQDDWDDAWVEQNHEKYISNIKMINIHRMHPEIGPIHTSYILTLTDRGQENIEYFLEERLELQFCTPSFATGHVDGELVSIMWPKLKQCIHFFDVKIITQARERPTKRRKI